MGRKRQWLRTGVITVLLALGAAAVLLSATSFRYGVYWDSQTGLKLAPVSPKGRARTFYIHFSETYEGAGQKKHGKHPRRDPRLFGLIELSRYDYSGASFGRRGWVVGVSPWLVAALLWCYPALTLVRVCPRTWRRARRGRRGLCVECCYDLSGNVSGVCPECGEPVAGGRRKGGATEGPQDRVAERKVGG